MGSRHFDEPVDSKVFLVKIGSYRLTIEHIYGMIACFSKRLVLSLVIRRKTVTW